MKENRLDIKQSFLRILVFAVILSVGFFVGFNTPGDNIDFFNNYVIAVNDYHIANSYFDLGGVNLDAADWYTLSDDYYYEDVIGYIDLAKEQFTDARALLIHSETKLKNIENKAPNQFYEKEIQNRIKQNGIMLSLTNKLYLLADYMSKELYEINYGSEAEATRYFNMQNDLIVEFNEVLYALSDVSQEIDLDWDSDWYPLTEGHIIS